MIGDSVSPRLSAAALSSSLMGFSTDGSDLPVLPAKISSWMCEKGQESCLNCPSHELTEADANRKELVVTASSAYCCQNVHYSRGKC
jgi:hypothetical protein